MLSTFDQHWLVGFLEADGSLTYGTDRNNKVYLSLRFHQHRRNQRVLAAIKRLLKTGKITAHISLLTLTIRKHHLFQSLLFPIFDQGHFLTHKYYRVLAIKHYIATRVFAPFTMHTPRLAPHWGQLLGQDRLYVFLTGHRLNTEELEKLFPIGWLSGFLEGRGSFYITKKAEGFYCCGFHVTHKHGKTLLEGIRQRLAIQATVRKGSQVWEVRTTSKKTCVHLAHVFRGCFKGVMSLKFNIWRKALHFMDDPVRMKKAQLLLQKIGQA